MPTILVVEDNLPLQRALAELLESERFTARVTARGDEAVHLASVGTYDIILLDIMLPGMDGIAVTRELRRRQLSTPILLITAKDALSDRILGLDAGADDYVTKPVAATELFARIRAHLRRAHPDYADPDRLVSGPMTYQFSTRTLSVSGRPPIRLSPKEATLVEVFLRSPGLVVTRAQLVDRLWGDESDILDTSLEAHISRLRRRLAALGGPEIVAVRGLGYRLDPPP